MQGKHSSSGVQLRGGGVELTLAVDKWYMGWVAMSLGWAGWVAERAHGICASFPLLCCLACL